MPSKIIIAAMILIYVAGCGGEGSVDSQTEVIADYPVKNLEGVITRNGVSLDEKITSDGNGSIRISVSGPGTYSLYETGDIDLDDARLIYSAEIRTENFDGNVFLEMICSLPGKGEYFSRDIDNTLTGTNLWSSRETMFLLKKGENPNNVRLNVVTDGTGTVWIDDIKLEKASPE